MSLMDKDICCLNFKGLFGYLENRFGKDTLEKLVHGAVGNNIYLIPNKNNPAMLEPVTIGHLTDEANWISNELSLALLGMIKTVVPGPHPEQTAGQAAVLETLSRRDLFFSKLVGPMGIARKVARVNAKFNRTKSVKISRLEKEFASIELHFKPGFRVTKDVCNWNLGIYMGVAKLAGARVLRAREVQCVLEGHNHCEIEFEWQVPSFFNRVYRMGLRFLTKDLLAEYEKTVEDRDRLIEKLTESESLFKMITGHTSALVSIHDGEARYIYAGHSHEQMGYRPGELIGKSSFTILDEEDARVLKAKLEKVKQGSLSKAFINYRLRDKEGKLHYYRGALDAVFRPSGALEHIVCVAEDITELRQVQAEKMAALNEASEARQLALVGEVSGKMAHDFNNILTIIMGISESNLIESKDPEVKKAFGQIFGQSLLGRSMTKNLVAFARDQEFRQESFRLNEKTDLVLSLLEKDLRGIQISRDYSRPFADIIADPGMIENALVNIFQNSIHALSRVEQPEIIVRTRHREDEAEIEIEDNGCGIPRSFLDLVFDPLFTLKGNQDRSGAYAPGIKGTGYGMANVKKYVEQHKGRVSVWSKEGTGTRITICLPVIKQPPEVKVKKGPPGNHTCCGKNILLVEDEAAISKIYSDMLIRGPGRHRVDVADNGKAALVLLNKKQYDLVCLDYVLPGGVSGMDIYSHVRQSNARVPVLFISGNIEFIASVNKLKQDDSCLDHLAKPFTAIEYFNVVNGLIRTNETRETHKLPG